MITGFAEYATLRRATRVPQKLHKYRDYHKKLTNYMYFLTANFKGKHLLIQTFPFMKTRQFQTVRVLYTDVVPLQGSSLLCHVLLDCVCLFQHYLSKLTFNKASVNTSTTRRQGPGGGL